MNREFKQAILDALLPHIGNKQCGFLRSAPTLGEIRRAYKIIELCPRGTHSYIYYIGNNEYIEIERSFGQGWYFLTKNLPTTLSFVSKEKNILCVKRTPKPIKENCDTFCLNEYEKSNKDEDYYYYDFITNKWYEEKELVHKVKKDMTIKLAPEWCFSYMDKLDKLFGCEKEKVCEYLLDTGYLYCTLAPKCPKGFVEYCLANDYKPSINALRLFEFQKKVNNVPNSFLKVLTDRFMEDELNQNITVIPSIWKLVKKELEQFNLPFLSRCESHIRNMFNNYLAFKKMGFDYPFDMNRTFEQNFNKLVESIDAIKNVAIANNLQKLNFINDMTIDNFSIVVPQNVLDLVQEGKQQNNCVGSYYNNSIAKGENLIYFVRKSNNKNKSYITCRYNTITKETVEYRKKNNDSIFTNCENELIKQIDKYITKYLV